MSLNRHNNIEKKKNEATIFDQKSNFRAKCAKFLSNAFHLHSSNESFENSHKYRLKRTILNGSFAFMVEKK